MSDSAPPTDLLLTNLVVKNKIATSDIVSKNLKVGIVTANDIFISTESNALTNISTDEILFESGVASKKTVITSKEMRMTDTDNMDDSELCMDSKKIDIKDNTDGSVLKMDSKKMTIESSNSPTKEVRLDSKTIEIKDNTDGSELCMDSKKIDIKDNTDGSELKMDSKKMTIQSSNSPTKEVTIDSKTIDIKDSDDNSELCMDSKTIKYATEGTLQTDGVVSQISLSSTGMEFDSGTDGVTWKKGTSVTQLTSLTTSITTNSNAVFITTFPATLAAETTANFTVFNTHVKSDSLIWTKVTGYNGTLFANGIPKVFQASKIDGSFVLTVANFHATMALNGAITFELLIG